MDKTMKRLLPLFVGVVLTTSALAGTNPMSKKGATEAADLRYFADQCELKLTSAAKKFIVAARKAHPSLFEAEYATMEKGPSGSFPCEVAIGNYVKGGDWYGVFGFDVLADMPPE
jgi:hypothetical protein